jgi:putative transposase
MPNHSHLIAVPESEAALRLAIGEAHRRYTAAVNKREGWTGHLWQGRFASFAMDARYTLAAARYVELNPVRAGLVSNACWYPWSSARAHMTGRDDGLVTVAPLLDRVENWAQFLGIAGEDDGALRKHASTGRPLGDDAFVDELEAALGRPLRPRKAGRKSKVVGNEYGVPAFPAGADLGVVASAERVG